MIAMLITLLSCNGIAQENKTPTITKTFDLDQPGTLNAKSSGGGIEVRTHDQQRVIVQAFIRKSGRILSPSDPLVADVLKDFDLDIEKNGSVVTANVERKGNFNFWKNVGISLTIITPREMSCNVSSSGGGVKISNVAGTHNFTSSGGGVKLENITGTTKASSSVGGVHLENIQGDVDAGSSGGGVTVTGVAGSVKAKSSGGSVRVNIARLSKELYLESSGGGVDAVIQNGDRLGLDLDLSSEKVNIDLQNFSGKAEKNRVKGTMNNGGIPVYMRASGGSVTVRFED
ncbi:MAG: DUF4097 domain-containing protein [Mangrovibacterium sp.]